MTENKPQALKLTIGFPWLSAISLMVLCGLMLTNFDPQSLSFTRIPHVITRSTLNLTLAIIAVIFLLSDLQRFFQQKRAIKHEVDKLEQELDYIWESKKKLQERSHIYSGHADKLKQFISDKLLDYIEYDEKFLHFKSIAAEVRHNGVISYDIVRTALEKAADGSPASPSYIASNLADTHRFGLPNNPCSDYQQALDAMKYLWDLLDLSTAENIALHIGNFLIECEEQYYQLELSPNPKERKEREPAPYFTPNLSLIKTIGPLMELPQMDQIIAQTTQENTINTALTQHSRFFITDLFRINLNATEHLLGNPNHLILLLENVIKNAQFFSAKSRFKQSTDRIAIQLTQHNGYIEFNIYNRGPHITEDNTNNIFQLGFSTRRVKEHHGKGLGMYFVKEIVKGYQGQVSVKNVFNHERSYLIRITLENQEIITEEFSTKKDGDRPTLSDTGHLSSINKLQLTFDYPLSSVEVSLLSSKEHCRFADLDPDDNIELLDTVHPFKPEWKMEIKRKRKQWHIIFTPLDIDGVEFSIKLPTAESRLNGTEPTFREDFEGEVAKLNEQFSEYDDNPTF